MLSNLIAAGSWDHFHKGHQIFLDQAFNQAEKVTVAITSEKMIEDKPLAGSLESLQARSTNVNLYLKQKKLLEQSEMIVIDDIYGPALKSNKFDSLLVTEKTESGGMKVNAKRQEKGLAVLELIKIPLAKAQDGKELSSERIRAGEINRQGEVYLNIFESKLALTLPDDLRNELKKPFGVLFPGTGKDVADKLKAQLDKNRSMTLICVGDVTTELFLWQKIDANLFIIDFFVGRKEKFTALTEIGFDENQKAKRVNNKPGTISGQLANAVKSALDGKPQTKVIVVDGEEDLAVLPAVLAAPLGSAVIYGQPSEGIVWVNVNEEKKTLAYSLLKKFKS